MLKQEEGRPFCYLQQRLTPFRPVSGKSDGLLKGKTASFVLRGRAGPYRANMSGIISSLLPENQRKDEQMARLLSAVKRKDKMIDAM
jgi:hypothetical protein